MKNVQKKNGFSSYYTIIASLVLQQRDEQWIFV